MAIQNGVIKIKGKLGDLVAYERNGKYVVRQNVSDKKQSENSKKSSQDFGSASRSAAQLRKAFAPLVEFYGNNGLVNRLNKRLIAVFNTIPLKDAGKKKLADGNISLLKGFEFNTFRLFDDVFRFPTALEIAPDGLVKLILPAKKIRDLIKPHPKAVQACLQVRGFHFDLGGNEEYEMIKIKDLVIPLNQEQFPKMILPIKLDHDGDKAFVVAMGIRFNIGGSGYSGDKKYFVCKIIHSLHLRDGLVVDFIPPESKKAIDEEEDEGLSWVTEDE